MRSGQALQGQDKHYGFKTSVMGSGQALRGQDKCYVRGTVVGSRRCSAPSCYELLPTHGILHPSGITLCSLTVPYQCHRGATCWWAQHCQCHW